MKKTRKIFYLTFTGILTSLAMTASYWQTNRYLDSKKRWKTIAKQLSEEHPKNISQLNQQQKQNLYAFKYLEIDGKLSDQYIKIDRAKGMRTGYLVLRKIYYRGKNQNNAKLNHQNYLFNEESNNNFKQMIALQGWCPENYQMKNKSSSQQLQTNNKSQKNQNHQNKTKLKKYNGILRKKQNKDYLHQKLKQSDLQKFKLNTWIDLQKYLKQFNIKKDNLNSQFYFQILKPLNQESNTINQKDQLQRQQYPYQYSVDNFQLPYLTPQKHQGYATFWFCSSLVGWFALIKSFKMK